MHFGDGSESQFYYETFVEQEALHFEGNYSKAGGKKRTGEQVSKEAGNKNRLMITIFRGGRCELQFQFETEFYVSNISRSFPSVRNYLLASMRRLKKYTKKYIESYISTLDFDSVL